MSFYSTATQLKQTPDQEDKQTKPKGNASSPVGDRPTTTPSDRLTATSSEADTQSTESQPTGLIRSIFRRFKDTYKEYGKALVAVHCVTSSIWFGSFYYTAAIGMDIGHLLQMVGASENFIEQITSTGLGNAAAAYLMYKLATPARYMVTILGTQLTVKYLRKLGYMAPVPAGDSLRELFHEGRSGMTVKYQIKRGEVKERMEELKEKADEMRDDMKDRLIDRASDLRDDFKFKHKKSENMDSATDKSSAQELKDKTKSREHNSKLSKDR